MCYTLIRACHGQTSVLTSNLITCDHSLLSPPKQPWSFSAISSPAEDTQLGFVQSCNALHPTSHVFLQAMLLQAVGCFREVDWCSLCHVQPLELTVSGDSPGRSWTGGLCFLWLGYHIFPVCNSTSMLLCVCGNKSGVTSVTRVEQAMVVGKSLLQGTEAPLCL